MVTRGKQSITQDYDTNTQLGWSFETRYNIFILDYNIFPGCNQNQCFITI